MSFLPPHDGPELERFELEFAAAVLGVLAIPALGVARPRPVGQVPGRIDEPRPPGGIRIDDLVPVPRLRAEQDRLAEREKAFLDEIAAARRRVIPFRVPVDRNLQVSPEEGQVVGVVQPDDLRLLHRKGPLPDESPELRLHPVEGKDGAGDSRGDEEQDEESERCRNQGDEKRRTAQPGETLG